MASGKVKWWNEKKGFGFIAQESGQDVFVHHTSILGGGFKNLTKGEEVLFDIELATKGQKLKTFSGPGSNTNRFNPTHGRLGGARFLLRVGEAGM